VFSQQEGGGGRLSMRLLLAWKEGTAERAASGMWFHEHASGPKRRLIGNYDLGLGEELGFSAESEIRRRGYCCRF